MENLSKMQGKQMDAMKLDKMVYDVAIFDGLMLYNMGSANIENQIDRIKDSATAVAPIKARGVYPAGGFYYMDFDIAQYIEFVGSISGATQIPQMQQLMAMIQGSEPVTSAGYCQDGCMMFSVNLPGDLIAKIGQFSMMMQMQKMQQGSAPQAAPAP